MKYADKIRNYLNSIHPALKFLIRILYPITLFLLMYFAARGLGMKNIQMVQLLFLGIWSLLEYFIFFRKRDA